MENLTYSGGIITIFLKKLWPGLPGRSYGVSSAYVTEGFGGMRIVAKQEGSPGRAADRKLAVSPGKPGTFRGKPVDIRSLTSLVFIAGDGSSGQVIGDNE